MDVKGLAGKTSWPVDNVGEGQAGTLLGLGLLLGQEVHDPAESPEVYVVPATELAPLVYLAPEDAGSSRSPRRGSIGKKHGDAWDQLV